MTGITRDTRALVLARDHHKCQVCDEWVHGPRGYSIHHRAGRGMGGSSNPLVNLPANLLTLCGSGTTGCHGLVTTQPWKLPVDVRAAGIVVPRSLLDRIATIPVQTKRGLVLLDNDGGQVAA